jgi:hypothetical protein
MMPFWIKVAYWIVEAICLWRLYREITRVRAQHRHVNPLPYQGRASVLNSSRKHNCYVNASRT